MPTTPPPLVSIITPTYNRADYLDQTMQSVLAQDYPRLEYIVLDDGSRDDTPALLARYAGRLRWETHANMGETRTVNKGFGLAAGDIIAVVNSDDPLLPGAVSAAVTCLEAHPEALAAYPDWQRIGPDGAALGTMQVREFDYAYMLTHHHCLVGPGAFIRRRGLQAVGGRDPQYRYVADLDFWLRLGLHGPLVRLPQVLATFREHPGSASSAARGAAMAREHVEMTRRFFARPDLPPALRPLRRQALAYAHFVAAAQSGPAHLARLRHSALFATGHPPSLLELWRLKCRQTPGGPLSVLRYYAGRLLGR
jgi:GT2 family glycosyltransferase